MTNTELDNIYKANIAKSHYAGLRGVWDAGYNTALGLTAPAEATSEDPSDTIVAPNDTTDTLATPEA